MDCSSDGILLIMKSENKFTKKILVDCFFNVISILLVIYCKPNYNKFKNKKEQTF